MDPAIRDYHRKAPTDKQINNWSLAGVEGVPSDGKLDLTVFGLKDVSMRVRVGRNLKNFPLPACMSREQRVEMESQMMKVFDVLIANPQFGGRYNSLTPNNKCFIGRVYPRPHFPFGLMVSAPPLMPPSTRSW